MGVILRGRRTPGARISRRGISTTQSPTRRCSAGNGGVDGSWSRGMNPANGAHLPTAGHVPERIGDTKGELTYPA
ncbi:hypothetical protein [Lysobacter gummosus]|uniref:hypothetical protein n=1 Tax=Lysobacter gummosus TaxID=262324 RepID=UPI00362E84AE